MKFMSDEQIKAAADPVSTCKEQIRMWKDSILAQRGTNAGLAFLEWNLNRMEKLLKELED